MPCIFKILEYLSAFALCEIRETVLYNGREKKTPHKISFTVKSEATKKIAFDEISAIVRCCGCSVSCFCLSLSDKKKHNQLNVLHLANIFRCFYLFELFFRTQNKSLRVVVCLKSLAHDHLARSRAVCIAKYKKTTTEFFPLNHTPTYSPLKRISRLVVFRFFQCTTSFTFKLNLSLVSISNRFFSHLSLCFALRRVGVHNVDFYLLLRMKCNLT